MKTVFRQSLNGRRRDHQGLMGWHSMGVSIANGRAVVALQFESLPNEQKATLLKEFLKNNPTLMTKMLG